MTVFAFAGRLVVGLSVELLCCSTSGSWDSNIIKGIKISQKRLIENI
jgi:hypothetical protein